MASNMPASDLLDAMEMDYPLIPVRPNQDREKALWNSSRAEWVRELRVRFGLTNDEAPEAAGIYADVLQQSVNE